MKKIYAIFCASAALLASSVAASAEGAGFKGLDIRLTDGSAVSVTLSDALTAKFTDTDMLISDGASVDISIPTNTIAAFEYTKESAGVGQLESDSAAPVVDGDQLRFSELPQGSVVRVYAVNGALLSEAKADGAITMPLSGFQTGIYVVTVNGMSYKITVKK